jgi:hypothetical protein
VQNHHGALGRGLQCGQHARCVHAAFVGVVVGVGVDGEAGIGEQGAVVLPARVTDEHLGVRVQALQKVGANFQSAGAAQTLHCGHAALQHSGAVSTKYQTLHCFVIGGNAVNWQITARLAGFLNLFFSGSHALEQWQLAVFIVINAHAQVDFGRVGVGVELLVEAQDRVAGGHFDGGEER